MKYLLRVLVGGALLTALLWKANSKDVLANLSRIPLELVAYCSIVFVVAWFVAAYKWHVLLPESRYRELLALSFIGQLYSWIFPGQIAGEIVKALRLAKGRANAEQLALSVLVDRLTGLIGLLCIAAIGLLLSQPRMPVEVSIAVGFSTVLLLAGLWSVKLAFVYRSIAALVGKAATRWPRHSRFASRIIRLLDGWRYYVAHPRRLLVAIFLGAAFQLIWVASIMILAPGIGINVPFFDWCWIFGLVSIAVLLPISIGGVGVREGAFVGALSLRGIPVEQSVALSLAGFAISLLGVLVGGVLELFRNTKPRGKRGE